MYLMKPKWNATQGTRIIKEELNSADDHKQNVQLH